MMAKLPTMDWLFWIATVLLLAGLMWLGDYWRIGEWLMM